MPPALAPLRCADDAEQSIVSRFEQVAAALPAHTAVVDRDRAHSYRELNERANRIAGAIREHSGEQPTRVAIFLEKGFDFLAAILGTLKAGHAYVPIDPSFPEARNRFIVENSDAALIVTNAAHAPALLRRRGS